MKYVLYMNLNGNERILISSNVGDLINYMFMIQQVLKSKFKVFEKLENHELNEGETRELLEKLGFKLIKVFSAREEVISLNVVDIYVKYVFALVE